MRRTALQSSFAASILVFSIAFAACEAAAAQERLPNIVVILADDFGVGDIQAHYPDNKIPTPYLDRFVRQGMSFTDAHTPSALCTPTRYGLLTGRYCWRTRLQEWVVDCYEPPLIDADRLTLPKLLKRNRYQTACFGKWHLGWEWPGPERSRMEEGVHALQNVAWDFTKPILGGPTERGFDHYFGTDVPNFPPFTFIENKQIVELPTEKYRIDKSEGVFLPSEFRGAPIAPGWRFGEILPETTRRAVEFVHQQAKTEAPFFLYFAMTSPHEPVVPSKKFAGKSGIAPIADFVMQTDWSAGQVIQAVDRAGIADNTIVLFTADNGHSRYTGSQSLERAGHLASGPFRGYKGDIWEGGHRVPCIIRWPGRVEAGSSSDQLLCLTDLFATFAELLGDDLPDEAAEDSFSFLPALMGERASVPSRTNLVSHSGRGEFAYREDQWKIVFKNKSRDLDESRGQRTVVELYDLKSDIGEQNSVADQHPEVVQQLTSQLSTVIDRGTSRPGTRRSNDTNVRFDRTQTERWAPALR